MISSNTFQGIVERLAYAALFALFGKIAAMGYMDQADAAYFAAAIVAAGGSAWATYINRPSQLAKAVANVDPANIKSADVATQANLAKAAAAIPNTTVVSSAAVSKATPEAPNIVSANEVSVVSK